MGDGFLHTRKKSALGLLSAILALTLLVTPALAAETFPAVNTYAGFGDVSEDVWYASAVKQCYETGLMNGTGKGNFSPDDPMSLAEAAAIAARLGSAFSGTAIPQNTAGAPWYQPYMMYLTAVLLEPFHSAQDAALAQTLMEQPTRSATRQEFFALLSAVTPTSELAAINSITALPDTSDESVLAFYNAGILTGTDRYGTFSGDRGLQRSEVAAMVARITNPSLRQSFIPQEKPGQTTPQAPGGQPSAPAEDTLVTVNGHPVSRDTFLTLACNIAYDLDYYIYVNTGGRLDLSSSESNLQYVVSYAKEMAVYRGLVEIMAEELGCSVDQLPARITPQPTEQQLQSYVQQNDLLCAKHILCPDSQTAQAVLDGLEAAPTLEQFNALLQVFGTDPGMTQNPDGYLFTAGEMVSEFETGVRSLAIGSYTTEPVQSQFGYHIIWRLDPTAHPELKEEVQGYLLDELLFQQADQAQVVIDEAAIAAIDLAAVYSAFLSAQQ